MRALCISDSHNLHGLIDIPLEGIDMIIHAGDASNQKDSHRNANELLDFLEWYESISWVKVKIFVPGNHDTSWERGLVKREQFPTISILDHEAMMVGPLFIFGSPYTPSFGEGWAYNKPRHKLYDIWQTIPENIDILITHGPPQGILDHTREGNGFLSVGCQALYKRVLQIQPKYHIFGHVHPEEGAPNAGSRTIPGCATTFINASVCNLKYQQDNDGQIIETSTYPGIKTDEL